MFFETHSSDTVIIRDAEELVFPAHFHAEYELVCVSGGKLNAVVDGREYEVGAGEALLIFPFQTHSYRAGEWNSHRIAIYSRELVGDFADRYAGKLPKNPIAAIPEGITRLPIDNIYLVKAFLYAVHGIFARDASFIDKSGDRSTELRTQILRYIDENFRGDCGLDALAEYTGYEYSYLSKYFSRVIGTPYTSFVNEYRVDSACRLLLATNKTVSEISGESGFPTIRSFNRVFAAHRGMTPSEYRKKNGSDLLKKVE